VFSKPFSLDHSLGPFAGVAFDVAVYCGRTWMPFLLGNGNGGLQARAAYFPGTSNGYRPGRSNGRARRIFPPLLLGFLRDHLHIIWPGFALLALLSAVLWRTNAVLFLGEQQAAELTFPASFTRTADRIRAVLPRHSSLAF